MTSVTQENTIVNPDIEASGFTDPDAILDMLYQQTYLDPDDIIDWIVKAGYHLKDRTGRKVYPRRKSSYPRVYETTEETQFYISRPDGRQYRIGG